jgi:hypothetical protein
VWIGVDSDVGEQQSVWQPTMFIQNVQVLCCVAAMHLDVSKLWYHHERQILHSPRTFLSPCTAINVALFGEEKGAYSEVHDVHHSTISRQHPAGLCEFHVTELQIQALLKAILHC